MNLTDEMKQLLIVMTEGTLKEYTDKVGLLTAITTNSLKGSPQADEIQKSYDASVKLLQDTIKELKSGLPETPKKSKFQQRLDEYIERLAGN